MDTSRVYGVAALTGACEKIAGAAPGSRNAAFFRESVAIFELVAGGVLDLDSTTDTLLSAGEASGLPRSEARTVLRSAYRRGRQRPRGPQERQAAFTPEVPSYPAEKDLEVLKRYSRSVLSDLECEAYLQQRGIAPVRVSRGALARSINFLGDAAPCSVPRQSGAVATERGYRLAIELVDGLAVPRSYVLRSVVDWGGPKSLTLKGARKKLVFANAAARALLAEKKKPELWGDEPLDVYVVEGEIDFLYAATESTETMRAVFGVASGSWGERFAVCIPEDARIVVATDDDDPGEKLAHEVFATLPAHTLMRWKPYLPGEDYSDAGGAEGGAVSWM